MRGLALFVCLVAVGSACGSSGNGNATGSTGLTITTTVSAARVAVIGRVHIPPTRRAIAAVDRSCGGRRRIRPANAALARRCDAALTDLAGRVHDFARALVFLRAPMDVEGLMADTVDGAQPIIDIIRSYRRTQCLTPSAPRRPVCESDARDLGTVIDDFERVLDRWPATATAT